MAKLRHVAAGSALGTLTCTASPPVLAHAGERGFILLLPTGLFQAAGTIAVAVSFLVVIWFRGAALRRAIGSARWRLFSLVHQVPASNSLATAVLVVLVAAGLVGSRDPLVNPLPLAVWTLLWVGLTFIHAVLGDVWPHINPWTAFAHLIRRMIGRRNDDDGFLAWPQVLGAWPAVVLLLLFAWFELVFPAPRDPAILAYAVIGYSMLTVAGMVLFGDTVWSRHAEIFSRFFRIVSWIAPLRTVADADGRRCLVATFPGARLFDVGSLSAAGVVFVVVALATVSFDGLSRTFWWLDLIGENPLEHPGRTALVGRNTLGLIGAAAALLAAYAATAAAGALWSGGGAVPALRRYVVSIVPIAFGYHFAHYLPSFLVDAQYALKALFDPLHLGWNLLGMRDFHVTASFLTHHASVEAIWYAQVGVIVAAHVAAVVALHGLADESRGGRRAAIVSEVPLTALMIGYTVFGLWLLSTPVAA